MFTVAHWISARITWLCYAFSFRVLFNVTNHCFAKALNENIRKKDIFEMYLIVLINYVKVRFQRTEPLFHAVIQISQRIKSWILYVMICCISFDLHRHSYNQPCIYIRIRRGK